MKDDALPKNSTNVRFIVPLVRLAETLAPRWVEQKAFELWGRPRKSPGRWGGERDTARAFALDTGSGSLAAWEWNVGGHEGTALLVHGWSGNAGQMSSFVSPLVARGYHVVAVDLPAHGESEGNFATVPLLAETVAALGRRLAPRLIIAHSLGATATTYALTKGLRPERLALLAPPVQLPPYLAHFASQLGLSERVQAAIIRRVEGIIGKPVSELDLRTHAEGFGHVEALVVHDVADVVVPHASSKELIALWPRARLLTTEGLSHDRIRRAAEVVASVVDFVSGQGVPVSVAREVGVEAPGAAADTAAA